MMSFTTGLGTLSNKIVRNGADGQYGTTSVTAALFANAYLIALVAKATGGTTQLFSFDQSCVKASTASAPGVQNLELNLLHLALI